MTHILEVSGDLGKYTIHIFLCMDWSCSPAPLCSTIWQVTFQAKRHMRHPPQHCNVNCLLVGGFNPFEKYESNWESSPNRGKNKKYLSCHQPVLGSSQTFSFKDGKEPFPQEPARMGPLHARFSESPGNSCLLNAQDIILTSPKNVSDPNFWKGDGDENDHFLLTLCLQIFLGVSTYPQLTQHH